jgi:hypothetical protein
MGKTQTTYSTFGTRNLNGTKFNFIFLTCIWVKSVIEIAREYIKETGA